MPFLPINLKEAKARGWDELDIIIVTGDAYIDHPSFGAAIIGRVLEKAGFRVGILPQPNPEKDEEFLALGIPHLFFGVTAGNMDSMVSNYTAQRKKRNNDAYSPDGISGLRPDRASLVYTNILKRIAKNTPIVLGGIEASLRRIAHYDFWQNKIRASLLADTKADILVYGMAERAILAIAKALQEGKRISELTDIAGTTVFSKQPPEADEIILPDNIACQDKFTFHQMTHIFEENYLSRTIYQLNGNRWIKHNPPAESLTQKEMDELYLLPFEYAPHPIYKEHKIPAYEQIKDSLTAHRGCYGGCSFCAIAVHQGRKISWRSSDSLVQEIKNITVKRKHKMTITDVGGPSANMYASFCSLDFPSFCKRSSCIYPSICLNLNLAQEEQLKVLSILENLPQVKSVFISSGIRHDLAILSPQYIKALTLKYTSGRLKLAPEHCVPKILRLMQKPDTSSFEKFSQIFFSTCEEAGIKRQIVPYLIVGHPGSTIQDAYKLRDWLKQHNLKVEQVQEFTPTPMTLSTCMYYTGLNYWTGKPVYIPKPGEIRKQKDIILSLFK